MKIPKLGVSTKILPPACFRNMSKHDFNVWEVNHRESTVHFNEEWIEREHFKTLLKKYSLSMHSFCSGIFGRNKQFTQTEISIFKSEILLCKILNAKELIFHMNFHETEEEKRTVRGFIKLAKKNKVDLAYESNAHTFDGPTTLKILSTFPELYYNLDFGHMNLGLHEGTIGYPLDTFLSKIRNRTIYVHAHNNFGEKDEHKSLDKGDLDWKHVLDMLDASKIRKIIAESSNLEDAERTIKLLSDYFKAKKRKKS